MAFVGSGLSGADLWLARLVYDPESGWRHGDHPVVLAMYEYGPWAGAALAIGALLALALQTRLPSGWVDRRLATVLCLTYLLGPGLMVNTILKPTWSRSRPRHLAEFGGRHGDFEAVFAPDERPKGSSFPSGHASVGFYLMTPYFPLRRRRPRWARGFLWGGLAFGLTLGVTRILMGAHFLTDVVAAGLITAGTAALVSLGLDRRLLRRNPTTAPHPHNSRPPHPVPIPRFPSMDPTTPNDLPSVPEGKPSQPCLLPGISVVVPVYNEVDNLVPLVERVRAALDDHFTWSLLLVDDGSQDGSTELIQSLGEGNRRIIGLILPHNCGQTTATAMGLWHARTEFVATMDADLQNDPGDLTRLFSALGELDAVVGWRQKRQDSWVRLLSSRVANGVRNALTGDQVRDTGCSLKLFRRQAIQSIPLFEGMHRFLPTLLRLHGYTVGEHPVSHHPRERGMSKYGIRNRLFRSLRDLIAVRWMGRRAIPHLPIRIVEAPEASS